MPDPSHSPRTVDTDVPSAARAYDYYLGGAHNFAADRELAERARQVLPCVAAVARLNRAFLRRAVLHMIDRGITQFLDLGSGIPTVGNVHEIAQQVNPACRVVYVDYEPVAAAHSEIILEGNAGAVMVERDIRSPRGVLTHPATQALLDFREPVGLLMVGVLLFLSDRDDPAGLVARYRDVCASGSYLALSHITDDDADPVTRDQVRDLVRIYQDANEQVYLRDRGTLTRWFAGTELVDPGVSLLADWRPDGGTEPDADSPARMLGYGGVARIL